MLNFHITAQVGHGLEKRLILIPRKQLPLTWLAHSMGAVPAPCAPPPELRRTKLFSLLKQATKSMLAMSQLKHTHYRWIGTDRGKEEII